MSPLRQVWLAIVETSIAGHERSEGSSNPRRISIREVLHCVQNDRKNLFRQPYRHRFRPPIELFVDTEWTIADQQLERGTLDPGRTPGR